MAYKRIKNFAKIIKNVKNHHNTKYFYKFIFIITYTLDAYQFNKVKNKRDVFYINTKNCLTFAICYITEEKYY